MTDNANTLAHKLDAALQALTKWRNVFTWWQLGKMRNKKDDPEFQAVADHREVTMLLRAENNALIALLYSKGVFNMEEYQQALLKEAETLSADYAKRFPGFKATVYGLDINAAIARDTMHDWKDGK